MLDGHKSFVLDGHTAELILVVARHRRRAVAVRGRRRRGRAEPDRAADAGPDQEAGPARVRRGAGARLIGAPGDGAAVLDRTLDVAAIALAAEQLGGAQRALDMAVEYAKMRHQFGRPIGSFQAIKHRCADLLLEVESLRSAVQLRGGRGGRGLRRGPGRRRAGQGIRLGRVLPRGRARTSRSTAASASPGSTTRTCTSSGPRRASCSSATPATTASTWRQRIGL